MHSNRTTTTTAKDSNQQLEEIKEIIEQAERFDEVTKCPGWTDIENYLKDRVNTTLIEAATKYKDLTIEQTSAVIRWNAQRELLDGMLAHISSSLAERQRIMDEYLKEKEDGGFDAASHGV